VWEVAESKEDKNHECAWDSHVFCIYRQTLVHTSIRSYFGSRLGGEGSWLSAGFLGRVLAAIAGCGSAADMLATASAEQVARWASIPEDRRWYILEQPTHLPHDAVNKPDECQSTCQGAPTIVGRFRHSRPGRVSWHSTTLTGLCGWCDNQMATSWLLYTSVSACASGRRPAPTVYRDVC
jgi:hypothetical protein